MLKWLSIDRMFKSFYYLSNMHFIALFPFMVILPNLGHSNIMENTKLPKILTYPRDSEIRQHKID